MQLVGKLFEKWDQSSRGPRPRGREFDLQDQERARLLVAYKLNRALLIPPSKCRILKTEGREERRPGGVSTLALLRTDHSAATSSRLGKTWPFGPPDWPVVAANSTQSFARFQLFDLCLLLDLFGFEVEANEEVYHESGFISVFDLGESYGRVLRHRYRQATRYGECKPIVRRSSNVEGDWRAETPHSALKGEGENPMQSFECYKALQWRPMRPGHRLLVVKSQTFKIWP